MPTARFIRQPLERNSERAEDPREIHEPGLSMYPTRDIMSTYAAAAFDGNFHPLPACKQVVSIFNL